MKALIDANDILGASGKLANVFKDCVIGCMRRLQAMHTGGAAVIDDDLRIVGEYFNKSHPNTQTDADEVSLRWLM